jgi:uncharacterized low-complexity protein
MRIRICRPWIRVSVHVTSSISSVLSHRSPIVVPFRNHGIPPVFDPGEIIMSNTKKPVALAVSAALVGGLLLSGSAFASTQLAQGYLLGADTAAKGAEGNCGGKSGEASCGGDKKAGEAKCGEGKCGMDKMDSDKDGKISKAEYAAAHKDGKGNFAKHDTNKDGFISANEMKATHEGKCGEGKCGGEKKAGEGKCGEGKCGGEKKAGEGKCGEGKCGGEKKAGEGKCGEGKCGGSI